MFEYDEESHTWWFSKTALPDSRDEFFLVGLILALAIFNDIIVDVQFPTVVYRKLQRKPLSLMDLLEVWTLIVAATHHRIHSAVHVVAPCAGGHRSLTRRPLTRTLFVPVSSRTRSLPKGSCRCLHTRALTLTSFFPT